MKDQLIALFKDHWPAMQAAIITILSATLINLINGLLNSPSADANKLSKILHWVVDHFPTTILTKKDAPGTFKMPFKASFATTAVVSKKKGGKAALIFFMLYPMAVSSCACWAEKANTKECIIARQVVDCTVGSIKDAGKSFIPVIISLISGGSPDWGAILTQLEGAGLANAGCIITMLQNDFSPKAKAMDSEKRKAMDEAIAAWRAKNLPNVQFKVLGPNGQPVLK